MIAFSKNGKGLPVILIHGFCERKEMWKTFSDHLSTSFTVYCPDLPGFGESTLQEEKTNLESIAVNLSEWMDEEGIREPVIIGHSLGGYVTLALAELLGNEIKGIGLFHSTAMPDDMVKKKTRNKTITFLKKHGVDKFMDSFVPPLFAQANKDMHADTIDRLIEAGKTSSLKGVIAYTEAMRDRKDRMEVWKNFGGKKLMIAGEMDMAVPLVNSRLHQSTADLYHELQGVGHMGMFEAKNTSISILESFLADI
ncbi:alpha/beta fold hydrolase [Arthrospiribacter ruber]|uniref:Alpha/beta hydrolase n=1 Tax=Arthrospiribacter ruber TaxID=2487934 RepID=A0A951IZK7_9BACT|nr:alpha/beta hydrolase [Arthrospiribacter ruber]MBW3469214.1 alpha/beta hydrolase [Arthrospiribacter ruber]